MSAKANLLGLLLSLVVGVALCVLFFPTPLRSAGGWAGGVWVGLAVCALYITGYLVGRADARKAARRRWDDASAFREGDLITLSDGSRMRVVATAPPEGDGSGG